MSPPLFIYGTTPSSGWNDGVVYLDVGASCMLDLGNGRGLIGHTLVRPEKIRNPDGTPHEAFSFFCAHKDCRAIRFRTRGELDEAHRDVAGTHLIGRCADSLVGLSQQSLFTTI